MGSEKVNVGRKSKSVMRQDRLQKLSWSVDILGKGITKKKGAIWSQVASQRSPQSPLSGPKRLSDFSGELSKRFGLLQY